MKSLLIIVFFFKALHFNAQIKFNQLDTNGKKDGFWIGVYPESKRPRFEGTFSHGKEVGVFTFFDDTKKKSIIATREFHPIDDSAYTIFYDENKNKVSEGKVVSKLYEGEWRYYHRASSVLMAIENYKNGKLDGLKKVFYPKGNKAEETNYKNNYKEGMSKIFAQNGVVIEESTYKNNSYDGLAIFRDTDGNLVSRGNFINGKKSGIWQFYEKGKLVKESNMSYPDMKVKVK